MTYRFAIIATLALLMSSITYDSADRVTDRFMPTGQTLGGSGTIVTFLGRPLDLAISTTGMVAIKNSHGIVFVISETGRIGQVLRLTREHVHYPQNLGGNGLLGIVWSATGSTVWSADGFGLLRSATRRPSGRFEWDRDIELPGPSGRFRNPKTGELDPSVPTGLALSDDEKSIYVASSRTNDVAVVDIATRVVVSRIPVGVAPLAMLRYGNTLFVTNLGGHKPVAAEPAADSGGQPVAVDARTGIAGYGSVSAINLQTRRVDAEITVGRRPGAMALSRDGRRLYVANADDDSITIIDTGRNVVTDTIALPLQRGAGAAPNALAVSPEDGSLYVSEGGDNRILILDGASLAPLRQIQTDWYPDGVAFDHSGKLYVTNLKGVGARGSEFGFPRGELGFDLFSAPSLGGFNVYDYSGTLQVVDPKGPDLDAPRSSRIAFGEREPHLDEAYLRATAVPVPLRSGQRSLFSHVIFVIKENHTYDDYFGDLTQGNGDRRLCAFPRNASPNHHALAERFGLFDNFYVNGTMSADGHQWTDEAEATDYVERNTASWARSYPSDGTDPLAYASTGFIWQRALDAGQTFRDYGEFTTSEPSFSPPSASWSQFYADYIHGTHAVRFENEVQLRSLAPYVDRAYPGFTLRISDQARASEFLREFRTNERRNNLPNLIVLQLGNDHTAGISPGFPTPTAAVADNDLALGRIVEAVSRSRYWRSTVVFVVEDDAQNGLDHVDGHRTMALVISAYNRPNFVDSRFYNQTSILRTIELILKLRPLTQFDEFAPPIIAPFGLKASLTPFTALPNTIPLDTLNPKAASLSGAARRLAHALESANVDSPDAIDPELLRSSIRSYAVRQLDAATATNQGPQRRP